MDLSKHFVYVSEKNVRNAWGSALCVCMCVGRTLCVRGEVFA